MVIKILLLSLFLVLISCTEKSAETSSKDIMQLKYSEADQLLEEYDEKVELISIIRNVPKDSVYLILRDYYAKADNIWIDDKPSVSKVIDTISMTRKMSKEKIASIIFNFKYEMITTEDVENDLQESYEAAQYDEGEEYDPQ